MLNRKALTIIEVVTSIVILTIVLGTYGGAAQGKARILNELKVRSVYKRLANVQLERMINLVHRNRSRGKEFTSATRTGVSSTSSFEGYTRIFSFEGANGKLDAYDSTKKTNGAAIPLLQMEARGTATGLKGEQFLAFPYPKELKYGYDAASNMNESSPANATFHNVTNYLRTNHRDILPLVSDEYLVLSNIDAATTQGRYDELGWDDGGTQSPENIPLIVPVELFTSGQPGGSLGSDAFTYERIRRYVYYRKIRENNLVFKNGVEGRAGFGDTSGDELRSFVVKKQTDIDLLYIQHLNNWTLTGGSSSNGAVSGVNGSAYDTAGTQVKDVGAVGTHSIMIMVIVRELNPGYDTAGSSVSENDFLANSRIKAVATGIACPTYGKNILWTQDLSYHRYAYTRIPGVKFR
jgi:hypothetical protein